MSLKYALIGCGRISSNHIQAAIDNNLEILALCDLVTSQAENLITKHQLDTSVKVYSDYIEMINNHEIDLIGIATESGKHASIALDCIRKRN